MKKLVIFPGNANNVFLKNELPILKSYFDEIYMISYAMEEEKFKEIITEYGIHGYSISKYGLSVAQLKHLFKWFTFRHVSDEIRGVIQPSMKGLKKIAYIIYYGLFSVKSYTAIEKMERDMGEEDSLYLYAFWLSRPAYAAILYAMMRRKHNDKRIKKIISRAHGYDLYVERNGLHYLPFREFISENLDEIHFISKHGRDYYKEKMESEEFGLHQPTLFVDYLGVRRFGERKRIDKKEEVVIASCSYVTPNKRLDLIRTLLGGIKNVNLRWIHIGGGKGLEELIKDSEKLFEKGRFFFYDSVANKDIPEIYRNEDVDFLINLSDSEGLPVTMMEAMSMGIPVIARDVGGISEIVNDRNGCLLYDTDDVSFRKAERLIRLRLEAPEAYRKYSDEAYLTWSSKFDADKNYRSFAESLI